MKTTLTAVALMAAMTAPAAALDDQDALPSNFQMQEMIAFAGLLGEVSSSLEYHMAFTVGYMNVAVANGCLEDNQTAHNTWKEDRDYYMSLGISPTGASLTTGHLMAHNRLNNHGWKQTCLWATGFYASIMKRIEQLRADNNN